jgi:hypothetical protein
LRSPDDLSRDTARVGWGVVAMRDEKEDALKYAGILDTIEAFLTDPMAARADYDNAMLAFMNDVIFRPGVVIQRG